MAPEPNRNGHILPSMHTQITFAKASGGKAYPPCNQPNVTSSCLIRAPAIGVSVYSPAEDPGSLRVCFAGCAGTLRFSRGGLGDNRSG